MDTGFVMKLLTRACYPALMRQISSCEWDKATKVPTTPGEREEQENSADTERADWYRYEVRNHIVDNKKKIKRQYVATEALYNLDGGQLVRKIHERNDHRYVGSPGAATLDLSKKGSKQVMDIEG